MMKNIMRYVGTFCLAFLLSIIDSYAEVVDFEYKASLNTKTSSMYKAQSDYNLTTFTRVGAAGVRMSVFMKPTSGGDYKRIWYNDYTVDNNGNITLDFVNKKITIGVNNHDFSGVKNYVSQIQNELADYKKNLESGSLSYFDFVSSFQKTAVYKILSGADNQTFGFKPEFLTEFAEEIQKNTEITNDGKKIADYKKKLARAYITFEPRVKVMVPRGNPKKDGYILADDQINYINRVGNITLSDVKKTLTVKKFNSSGNQVTWSYSELESVVRDYLAGKSEAEIQSLIASERNKITSVKDIYQFLGLCKTDTDCYDKIITWAGGKDDVSAPEYAYSNLVKNWNEMYNITKNITGRDSKMFTVKELATEIMKDPSLACADDKGYFSPNVCVSTIATISNHISTISTYMYLSKEIGQWHVASKNGVNNWVTIADSKSGYGIGVIHVEIDLDKLKTNSECSYKNGKLYYKEKELVGDDIKKCCVFTALNESGMLLWNQSDEASYNKFKFKNGKSGELSDLYKKYCTSPCTIKDYDVLKELSNAIIIEDNKIKSFDIALYVISKQKCCNYDEYESDELKGITKNEFNSNVAKACNFCNKDINSATKLSDVMYNIPNTKESLNCCYWENFGLSDDDRQKNSGLSKTKFNNVVKNKKFCQDYCTFDKSLGKGERYYNGLDCCKWTNYGKAGDAEETRKLRIQNAGNRTMTELKNTEEYKLICPTTNDFCEFDYDNNKLILNGNETNDCCESPDLWKSQTEYDKFRKYDNGKYYNQFCKTEKNYCTALKIRDENRLECCDDLSQYSESVQQTIKINYGSLENYLKTEYNQIYYQYCPTNDGGCNPHIESSCPNCDTNHNGLTYDSVKNIDSTDLNISDEAKKCIFDNDDYEYEELSNKYCSIYCTQKIEYNYPSKIMPTGGRYITVGENGSFSPIKNITSMTCRISKVDTKTFEKDLKNAEKELKEAYNEYSKNAEPIENKEEIINTENGSEKLNNVAENVCDCKNNVTGLSSKDNKCCESTANETLSGSQVSSVKKIYAQVIDAKEKPAPSDKNSCNSANGSWITTKEEPYSSYDVSAGSLTACGIACGDASYREKFTAYCADGYEAGSKPKCESHGGMISSKCTCKGGTNTVKLDNPYCANYRKQYYCEDGYTLSGTKCIPDMPSNLECERDSDDNVKCNYYSCDSTINVGSEKGYLSSSKEGYVLQKDAKCTYKYCKTRNYLKYDYQTYNKYSYGESKKLTQKANNVKTCSNNDDYYETVFKRQKQIALQNLMAAEKKYNEIVKNYKSCFSIDEKMGDYLNYDIKVKLDYNNAGIYTVNQELKRTETNSTDQDYIKIKKDYEIAYLDYGNNYEFKTKKQEFMIFENMNRINSVKKTKTYNYKLSSDTYLYVGKDSWSKTSSEINSIYIGNHLPVAYNPHNDSETTLTLTTTYDEGKIKNSSFANALCKDEYMCKLTVNDNSGCIIPVYRPISLKDPFPDQDGTGRQTGINWCYGNNCANTNETVKSVITNNRTVKEDSVYNLIPLYTITLKPGDIKEIRNYNATTTYGDYDLLCENNTGKFCKSRFLRGDSVALEGEEGRYNISHLINQNRSCALNESLQGCIPGDYYDTGGGN